MKLVRILVFLALVVMAGAADLAAQNLFTNPHNPTISPVPLGFVGTWKWNTPRQNCGTSVDSYGKSLTFGDNGTGGDICQWPIDQLEKVMNGRGRAWEKFVHGDDAISPRWTCVAAGLGINLTEGYLRTFSLRPDALVMNWEQSAWIRYVYTDGRKHAPASDVSYHGDAIGWMEGKTFVVETTNMTWDPDGYDDHSHIARSHMAKITERYTLKDLDNMELAITVEDPLFLKAPFTFVGSLAKTNQVPIGSWDCDPDAGARELYETVNNPYPDDTTPEKYFGIK